MSGPPDSKLPEALLARTAELTRQVEQLKALRETRAKRVEELPRELEKSSSTSNKPP